MTVVAPPVLTPEKKAFLDAEVAPFTTGAEELVTPRCPYFHACGGCHLQHLSYADQLAVKVRWLADAFARHEIRIPDMAGHVHGMADPWYYRNKADFNARTYGGQVRVGFNALGTGRVLDVEHCAIASRPINDCLSGFKKAFPDFPELKRKLHSLILRSSRRDERVVALYHTRLKDPAVLDRLTDQVRAGHAALAGGGFVRKGKEIGHGDIRLADDVRGIEYTYSPSSFFQANPAQTETLARLVEEYADPGPSDVVLDVYSGVGLFSLLLAPSVREVWAIEDTPRAVKDALDNARASGITNCHFLKGQAEERLAQIYRTRTPATLAVLDPPRSGCSQTVLSYIRMMEVARVVMVSCNARALARDVSVMQAGGYRLQGLSLVDMFPQTLHLECVAHLVRRTAT
jgi:23S rRNA (uracil1939-C5)-methyltransferase